MQIPILRLEDRRFYVYMHLRIDTGKVFYVGKGKGYRSTVASKFHRNIHWIRICNKAGGFLVMYVRKHMTEIEAFKLEKDVIKSLRNEGYTLCNMTAGGDGTSGWIPTEECRRKIGDAHRGKTLSPEVRRKISDSVKASGYVINEETRKKISLANIGHKRSLGYRHTVEWKGKQREWVMGNRSRSGQRRSEYERSATSMANKGRSQPIHVCPHCGKMGGNAMHRWHFSNCRERVA